MDSCIKRLRDLSSSQFGLLSLFKMRVLATGGLLLLLTWAQENHCGVHIYYGDYGDTATKQGDNDHPAWPSSEEDHEIT